MQARGDLTIKDPHLLNLALGEKVPWRLITGKSYGGRAFSMRNIYIKLDLDILTNKCHGERFTNLETMPSVDLQNLRKLTLGPKE